MVRWVHTHVFEDSLHASWSERASSGAHANLSYDSRAAGRRAPRGSGSGGLRCARASKHLVLMAGRAAASAGQWLQPVRVVHNQTNGLAPRLLVAAPIEEQLGA